MRRLLPCIVAVCCVGPSPVAALDHVVFRRAGVEQEVVGRIVVTATDGGVMLETRDGTLWSLPIEEQVSKRSDDEPFRPFTSDEAADALRRELPAGFEVYQTKHFIICFTTSRAYAQWCGSLFERLYQGFHNYWKNRGVVLREPEFPLTAVVFADRGSYVRFAQPELGDRVEAIIGYYSFRTNRMTMYDLTGTAGTAAQKLSSELISQTLARPDAAMTVATIVHEATHQIAYNCGLHQRYADIPLWVSEGMAIFFETPDFNHSKGWSTIGAVNRYRLAAFYDYARRRPPESLKTLLWDDARMTDPKTAGDAYAEAWALNYFLISTRIKQYEAYLKVLAAKGPAVQFTAEDRLAEFRAAFGDDLGALDRDFLKFIGRVR